MPIGPWELAILVVVVLLIFGSRRLPEMGRSIGKGMREFKDSVTGKDEPDDEPDAAPPELTAHAVEEEDDARAEPPREREHDRAG